MKAELELIARDDLLGEGPVWDVARGRLVWSDVKSATIYEYVPANNRREVLAKGVMAFSLVLNKDGALLITGPTGLHHFRPGGEPSSLLADHQGESLFFNDAIADHRGRVYAGTVYWGPSGLVKMGKLYLIDGAGSASVVDEGIKMANGLGFSPDDRTLYFTDSLARAIFAYDVHPETGELSRKRVFVQIPSDEGMPDGMTVDADGHVWSAQWYGGQVVRYDPDGKVERRIEMPVRQVASVMFGGDDLGDLYITTASDPFVSDFSPPGYDYGAENHGGPLYRVRPGVTGRAEHLADLRPRSS
jgi:D-xylonolactonase